MISELTTPSDYFLFQNYPNPFNPETNIRFQLPKESGVRLRIFNILGKEIRNLTNRLYQAGEYSITWDGHDERGNPVPSGIYFYQLKAGNFSAVKKLTLLR